MNTPPTPFDRTITHGPAAPVAGGAPDSGAVPERYTLQDCLGRGGFGVVYRAIDRNLGRPVAIKLLHDPRRTDLERFRREARFAARLNSPAIVHIYEFGETGHGAYIAMQLIDGGNIRNAGLSASEAVRAIAGVARALAHAHREGIVHRDIKPGNILVGRDGRTYLTDFGIARDLRGGGQTLSGEGALVGTPATMAPEQARGELRAIDARTDIYALGATLYALLCGRFPFTQASLPDLLHAVVHEAPPLPRSIDPSIPRALEACLLRCLEKKPAARYTSMDEVAAALEAWLAGRPGDEGNRAWFQRLVGAPAPPAGHDDTALFQEVALAATRAIAGWDAHVYRVSSNLPRLYPRLDAVIARLDGVIRERPHLAWARFYRGMALFRRGELDAAFDEMERSIDRLADQADAQFEMGRVYLAIYLRALRRARRHFSRSGVARHLAAARKHVLQAEVCFAETARLRQELLDWQVDFARAATRLAEDDFAGCIAACDAILARDEDLEEVWRLRGDAERFAGRDPFDSYRRAVDIRRSDHGAWLSMAEAWLDRRRFDAAHDCLASALAILPDHVDTLAQLGRVQLERARQHPERAAEILADAHASATRAAGLAPDNYEARVALGEVTVALAKLRGEVAGFDRAAEELAAATRLPGCQNRVEYLLATARLERARCPACPRGEARAALEANVGLADGERAREDTVWEALIAASRARLAELDGEPPASPPGPA